MSSTPTPTAEQVAKLLKDLLGKTPVVKKGVAPTATAPRAIAFYSRNDEPPSIAWVCDLPAAASCAAALALIPVALVNESVKAGKLSEGLEENLHEFFNVGAGLFAAGAGTRIVLGSVITHPAQPTAELLKILSKPTAKTELEVSIPGYVPGKMAIYVA